MLESSGRAGGEPVLLPSGDVLFCQGGPYLQYELWDVETSSFRDPAPAADPAIALQQGARALALPEQP